MTLGWQDQGYRAGPPSEALARIGADVAARLADAPGVQKLPLPAIDMFVVPDFLDPAACAELVAMIDADSAPSEVLVQADYASGFRTSHSCNLDRWDDRIQAVDGRLCNLLGLHPAHGESLQGQRYTEGQQFKAHHDFFHLGEAYWAEQEKRGGQRSWTAMIYLDEPEAGGETHFPAQRISISPRTGLLVIWNNMAADGSPNLDALHAGLPVTAGTKHIVTKWFRERPWL